MIIVRMIIIMIINYSTYNRYFEHDALSEILKQYMKQFLPTNKSREKIY